MLAMAHFAFIFCINEEHYDGQIASSVFGQLSARRRSLFGESFLSGATVFVGELSVLPVLVQRERKKSCLRLTDCITSVLSLSHSAIAVCLFVWLFVSLFLCTKKKRKKH